MKKIIALALALVMCMGLAACGAKTEAPAAAPAAAPAQNALGTAEAATSQQEVEAAKADVQYKDTVLISASSEIQNPYLYSITSTQSTYIANMTHETLYRNDYVNGGVMPVLAEDAVDVNGDGLVWKITLKPGVMFHFRDQEYKELKASDVKFTWEWTATDGEGATSGVVVRTNASMSYIDSIETEGDYTVIFNLKNPMFDFPSYCTQFIISEDAIKEFGTSEGQEASTGPYYVNSEKSTAGQEWTLTRYDGYWGGIENHPTKNIVFVIHTDANTGVAALQAGEVDLLLGLSATNALMFMNSPDYSFFSVPGTSLPTLFFNSYDELGLFDGEDTEEMIKLRQAVKLAIDKDKVVSVIFAANPAAGVRLDSLWNPATKGFVDCGQSEFNVEKARALMEELGYNDSNRLPVKLAFYASYTDFAQILQDLLKEIYIDVECVTMDSSVFGTTLRTGEGWDMALNYYSANLTMSGTMSANLASTGSNAKVYGWNSAVMDEKINDVLAKTTAEEQLAAFAEFQAWANDYNPRIPIYTGNTMHAGIAELEGFAACPNMGETDFTTVRIPA